MANALLLNPLFCGNFKITCQVVLDSLIDEVGENESHPLASLMEIIGILRENYEEKNVPEL